MTGGRLGVEPVRISKEMSDLDREAAVSALTSGVRQVQMPAGGTLLRGGAVHETDRLLPYKGYVVFWSSMGVVTGRRLPARPDKGILLSYYGPRSFGVDFHGSVDETTQTIDGTVTSQVKRYNRLSVGGSVVAGPLIGLGLAVDQHHLPLIFLFGPLCVVLLLLPTYVTNRREAKILVADLERMAYFAVGSKPPPGRYDENGHRRY